MFFSLLSITSSLLKLDKLDQSLWALCLSTDFPGAFVYLKHQTLDTFPYIKLHKYTVTWKKSEALTAI